LPVTHKPVKEEEAGKLVYIARPLDYLFRKEEKIAPGGLATQ